MAHLADIVFDCRHPASLARFWAEVLDGDEIAPYDDAELERLAGLGIQDPDDDPTVLLEAPAGPRLWFQAVPEPKLAKNRVHLDVAAPDVGAEVARLEAAGARRDAFQPNATLVVLRDPEGNEFCVVPAAIG